MQLHLPGSRALPKLLAGLGGILLLAAVSPQTVLAQCLPDGSLSSVEPWDTYGQVFVVPGTTGHDVVTVTVLCAGSIPLANALVEIEFLDCDLCYWNGDHHIVGYTDGSGIFTYDPQIGGCASCEVRVTVEGVVLRSYTQVVSPDWDGAEGDGIVNIDDGAWFAPYLSQGIYHPCADLDGNTVVNVGDSILLTGPALVTANQPGCDSTSCLTGFTKTYTLNADFNMGTLTGAVATGDQVQLSATGTTFGFAWVANSGEGSVSKINTATGNEVARYFTGPPNASSSHSYLSPSRTAVDEFGNCWVANRTPSGVASVTQILVTGGVDRNSSGSIETSMDASADGIIQTGEMQLWGSDERVVRHYAVGNSGDVARGLVVDKGGYLWVGLYSARRAVRLRTDLSTVTYAPGPVPVAPPEDASVSTGNSTPYGLALSCNGNIYGTTLASRAFEIDPGLVSGGTAAGPSLVQEVVMGGVGGVNYGIACDGNGIVWIAKWSHATPGAFRWDPGAGTWANAVSPSGGCRGITVDFNGNVWTVSSTTNLVHEFNAAGAYLNSYPAGTTGSVGVGVSQDQNIIVSGKGSWTWRKLSSATGALLSTGGPEMTGPAPYSYSDISGNLQNIVNKKVGTWSVITDAGDPEAYWEHVSWNENVPANTSLTVRIRAASTLGQLQFENWQEIMAPGDLSQLLPGRYLETEVVLAELVQCNSPFTTPILYDLTVKACMDCNIVCPPDTTVQCTSYEGAVVTYSSPWVLGACDSVYNITCTPPSGSQFPLGQTTVTCTGEDINGEEVYECKFVVTVEGNCDIDASGACCLNGDCFISTPGYCLQRGGTWHGIGSNCTGVECDGACLRPPRGLTAWWPFDGAPSGVTPNLADPLAPGNLVGGVTPAPGEYVTSSYEFLGGQYILVAHRYSVDVAFEDFSMDVWVKTSSSGEMTIMDKRFNGPLTGYRVYLTGGYPALQLASIGNTVTAELNAGNGGASAYVADGQWHLLAVTVDRDGTAQFYVDGSAVGVPIDPTSVQTTLSNNIDLRIGRSTAAATSNDYFVGMLDELEMFKRPLTPEEISDIYAVGEAGKCREACYASSFQTCCDEINALIDVVLCNYDEVGHTYSWSISPVTGPECYGSGATALSNGWGTVNVGPGSCISIPVEMLCPSDVLPGQEACYQVQVFNHDTGKYFYCGGSVRAPAWWCPSFHDLNGPIGPMLPIDPQAVPVNMSINVLHIDLVPGTVTFDYQLLPVSFSGDSSTVLSLNGMLPGTPVAGQVQVPGDGSTVQIPFTLEYSEPQQIGYDKVILMADVMDSSGQKKPIAEVSVRSKPIPVTGLPDPETPIEGDQVARPFRALPNPFRSSGMIEFEVLGEQQNVTLQVFDLAGRMVKELYYKEPLDPGLQRVDWDGTDGHGRRLSSGIYFLRLQTADYSGTVKIALVR